MLYEVVGEVLMYGQKISPARFYLATVHPLKAQGQTFEAIMDELRVSVPEAEGPGLDKESENC